MFSCLFFALQSMAQSPTPSPEASPEKTEKTERKCLAFDIETGEQIGENRGPDYIKCAMGLRDAIKKEYCEPGLKKFSYNHQNGENKPSKRTIYCP